MAHSSPWSGFYNKTIDERLDLLAENCGFSREELQILKQGLRPETADSMIENVTGVYGLPLGLATNFRINGREVLIPMVIEEPSVVAGASYAARLVHAGGGFKASAVENLMIGQIQVLDIPQPESARLALLQRKEELLARANIFDPVIVKLGGGAKDIEVRVLSDTPAGAMLVMHLLYDPKDAMGANTVNTAVEALAPLVEEITGGRVLLRILSNLADRRLAQAECLVPAAELTIDTEEGLHLSGGEVARRVVEAYALAAADPYRAATHNKGIMNGIDAVVIATGNDWRAIEAGAHAYAARSGRYTSLSRWSLDAEGNLQGFLELPLAVGIVGGSTNVHPLPRLLLRLMGVTTSRELAEIIAAVGLAQNLAAIRALASEGIQRGHMRLHARQIAMSAGATGEQIEIIAAQLVKEKKIRLDRAQELMRGQ